MLFARAQFDRIWHIRGPGLQLLKNHASLAELAEV